MTDVRSIDMSNVQQVVDKFLAKGCNAIIITLGPLGAAYATKMNRTVIRIPTVEVYPVDTTVSIAYIVIVTLDEFHEEFFEIITLKILLFQRCIFFNNLIRDKRETLAAIVLLDLTRQFLFYFLHSFLLVRSVFPANPANTNLIN